jgi:hypothetical protein
VAFLDPPLLAQRRVSSCDRLTLPGRTHSPVVPYPYNLRSHPRVDGLLTRRTPALCWPQTQQGGGEIQSVIGRVEAPVGWAAVTGSRMLRGVLAAQVVLGLLWGVSMLFFAPAIVLGDSSGPHIEKIAIEGGAHLMLVFAAILVWRAPRASRGVLLLMVFLNALWAATDAVYIPLLSLTQVDFGVKLAVNAGLALGLAVAGRRAGIL